ncbi:hypothetical protein ACEXOS_016415 [Herbiconiux sp. P16]|uniref:hypothetical protein n=1 Tax=Herbiconiux wuyangfengii TaxID=3342794 RepID=UPI0035B6D252
MKHRLFGRIVATVFLVTALGGGGIQNAQAGTLVPLTLEQPTAPGEVFLADSAGVFGAVFSGRTEEGETVTVATNAGVLCQAVAGADERWSCTATTMPDFFGDVAVSDSVDILTRPFGAVNPPAFAPEFAAGVRGEDAELVLSGRSAGGALVEILRDGVVVCTTTANGDGKWSCTLASTDADAGISTLTAVQTPPYSPVASAATPPVAFEYEPPLVVTPVIPVEPVTPDPPIVVEPPGSPPVPGSSAVADPPSVSAPVADSPPGSASEAGAISEYGLAATETASAEVPAAVGAPSTTPVGRSPIGGRAAAPAPPDRRWTPLPDSDAAAEAASPSSPATVSAGTTGWAAPTAFGTTLRPLGAVPFGDPAFTTSVVLVVLGLLVLLALPAELLQSTLRENYDRIAPRFALLERVIRSAHRRVPPLGWLGQIGVLAAAAIVTAFADPTIGFDPRSLRLMLALMLVLFLVNYVGILANHLHAARVYRAPTSIAVRPAGLLLVAASVVVSRAFEIQPGLLFGLILGLEVGGRLRRGHQAKIAVSVNLVLLSLGVGSWLAFGAFGAQWQEHPTFDNQLAGEVLTGITVETITAMVIALLPLTFLDGKTIYSVSKAAWAGLYALALAAFTVVILPLPSTWVEVPSLLSPWAIAFAAFALLSVGVWVSFRIRRPAEAPEREGATATRGRAGADRLS